MKILIIRNGSIGDTIVSLPAIFLLLKKYSEAKIDLLTERDGETNSGRIIKSLNIVDEIFYWRDRQSKNNYFHIFGLIIKLRGKKYDYIYNFSEEKTELRQYRDGIIYQKIIKPNKYYTNKGLVTERIKKIYTNERLIPEWKRLINIVGVVKEYERFKYDVPLEVMEKMLAKVGNLNINDFDNLIAVSVGSNMAAKQWPIENFQKIIVELSHKYKKYKIAFIGGMTDYKVTNELIESLKEKNYFNLCGMLTVIETAAFLSLCKLHIGNDSGPMHLASMVGTKCISIYSARDAVGKWDTLSENNNYLRSEVDCKLCMLTECTNNQKCMTNITVELVKNEINKINVS